jgi:hypothetical protein
MMSNLGISELMMTLGVVFAIMILPMIFYLLTLYKALNRCAVESRTMAPELVWLAIIPLFGLIWQFMVVTNMGKSLHNEFVKRGIEADPNPGYSVGIAMCILNVCSVIPFVGILTGLAGLVCWIIYWVQISDFSGRLA